MHWYDDLPHVGYDVNGKKVLRPARGDELDKFLKTVDDAEAWYEPHPFALSLTLKPRKQGRWHLTRNCKQTSR